MQIEDLRPGDIIATYKKPKKWALLNRFFHWCLVKYARRIYGKKCVYPHLDHNRVVNKEVDDLGFGTVCHWTDPAATYDTIEKWMVESSDEMEVHVFRPRYKDLGIEPPEFMDFYREFAMYVGKLYDIFDLPGMLLGLVPFFHGIGKKNLVCSTGARLITEDVSLRGSVDPQLSISETPPCWPAQYPNLFDQLV